MRLCGVIQSDIDIPDPTSFHLTITGLSQTTMERFLRSSCIKYFPDFSVTRGARKMKVNQLIFHCPWCPGTWSFYARVKFSVQIIMCENYFQKLCSQGVYTICFTPNWGNLNHPAPGPGHISSKWQLVIMNVIFSSRVVTQHNYSTRPGGWRKTFLYFIARKWWWTITVSYIRNYDNFVGVL